MTTSRGPDPVVPVLPGFRDRVAALFARGSVRRYARDPVGPDRLEPVRARIGNVRPLVPGNGFDCAVRAVEGQSEALAAALGSYARIVSAGHFLAARLAGSEHPLLDFGFRVEQLVIELARLGLGSCWVGTLQHEAAAQELVGAGSSERVSAVVMFGRPAAGAGGRLVNRAIRAAVGAPRRLAFERFAFRERYGEPLEPRGELRFILDCLRHAPSAGNARPWRVVLQGGELFFCVAENAGYYRLMNLARWGYPLLDAGIGLAHLDIALAALGREPGWQLLEDRPELRRRLGLPAPVRPVARVGFATAG